MNPFGISEKSYQLITATLKNKPEIEHAIIFGSRAKGTYKNGSDIDLAIKGKNCSPELAIALQTFLNEELPIPYHVDVVNFASLHSADLIAHIERVGKTI
jgi:uncharacterized protein